MATGDDSFAMAVTRQWRPAIGLLAIALVAGGITSSLVRPVYRARATLWIEGAGPHGLGTAPQELLGAPAIDSIVRRFALYVNPAADADAALFRGLTVAPRFMLGDYFFTIYGAGKQWHLEGDNASISDSGAAGDSVGRRMGLLWQPDPALLARHSGTTQHVFVSTPNDARRDLNSRLSVIQPGKSKFMSLELIDVQPDRGAKVLNAIGNAYIERALATGQARITMLDSAVTPTTPYRGSRSQVLTRALLIGLAMGLGAAILLAGLARRARPAAGLRTAGA